MPNILVIGATGTIGTQVVAALRERGAEVRAGVRDPAKATALRELGAQLVRFDYADPSSYAAALDGIERVFSLSPFSADFEHVLAPFAASLREAGIAHVVRISASGADPASPLELGRRHAAAEAAIRDSGVAWTILRPTFFMDNFINFAGASVREQGTFYGASKDQPVAYVSTRDIAEVAAEILLAPSEHAGQTYALTGPSAVRDTEVAQTLSEALGREVRYIDLSPDQISAGAMQQGAPAWRAEALAGLETVKAQGWAAEVSPAVAQVLGREGERFDAFVTRNLDRLAS